MKVKLKPFLPSMREKKRYIKFKVDSEARISSFSHIKAAIEASMQSFVGELGLSYSGLDFLDKLYDSKNQTGVTKVNHKYCGHLRASFALIDKINKQKVIVRSLRSSGMLGRLK